MTLSFFTPLAAVTVFGSELLGVFALLGGLAGFISLFLTLRQLRAGCATRERPALASATIAPRDPSGSPTNTSPTPPPAATAPLPALPLMAAEVPGDVLALISAAVAMRLGPYARVAAVAPTPGLAVLDVRQQWSVEGRRQIYSSHQIR